MMVGLGKENPTRVLIEKVFDEAGLKGDDRKFSSLSVDQRDRLHSSFPDKVLGKNVNQQNHPTKRY